MPNFMTAPVVDAPANTATATGVTYLYLYAIVAADAGGALSTAGIEPTQPLYRLGEGQVQAVVSRVPAQAFSEEAIKAGLQTIAWVERYVRAHQQILDQLVATGQPLLPLRFCTIYRDESTVQALLANRESALLAELHRLAHKTEWGVKLFVELPTMQQAILNGDPALEGSVSDPEIAALQQRIRERPGGAAFLYKKKLEALVVTRADEYTFALADGSHARLAEQAVAAVTNPLAQNNPELRLNAAYLVEETARPAFQATIEALAASYGPLGLRYEISGPWPVYNFLNLTLAA